MPACGADAGYPPSDEVPNVDLGHQSATLVKSPPGPPITLGNAANAKVRLIVWCKACGH